MGAETAPCTYLAFMSCLHSLRSFRHDISGQGRMIGWSNKDCRYGRTVRRRGNCADAGMIPPPFALLTTDGIGEFV